MDIRTIISRYYLFKFLIGLHFFTAVLVPFFTDWGHISLFQVQILQAWFMLCIFILEVPTGAVADYFGRKHSLAAGALTMALACLLYGSIPHFGVFLVAEFLFAASFALFSGADQALLYDSLKAAGREGESKKIFGKAHTMELWGILIAAPIGSYIAVRFGLNVPTLLVSVPALASFFVVLSIPEPHVAQQESERQRYVQVMRDGFRFFRSHRELRLMAVDMVLVAAAAYFVIWLYQPALQSIQVPIVYFGMFNVAMLVAEILIANNFERLEQLCGSAKQFLNLSTILTGAMFVVTALWPNVVTVSCFVIIAGGFGLTRMEFMSAYMNHFIPSDKRATVLSSISMLRRLVLIGLNPIVGFLATRSLQGALLGVGIIPFVVLLFSPLENEMFQKRKTAS